MPEEVDAHKCRHWNDFTTVCFTYYNKIIIIYVYKHFINNIIQSRCISWSREANESTCICCYGLKFYTFSVQGTQINKEFKTEIRCYRTPETRCTEEIASTHLHPKTVEYRCVTGCAMSTVLQRNKALISGIWCNALKDELFCSSTPTTNTLCRL